GRPSVRCPFCSHVEDKGVDSRMAKEGEAIRRRRECLGCKRRFTTYERVEEMLPMIIKKDGRRESFDRAKVLAGLKKACEKRPISMATLEAVADRIEQRIRERGEGGVPCRGVGGAVMAGLEQLDQVACVRFASVSRAFKELGQCMDQVRCVGRVTAG